MTHTLHRLPALSMSGLPTRSRSLLLTHSLQPELQEQGLMQLLLLQLGMVTARYVTLLLLRLHYLSTQPPGLLTSWH